MMSFDADCDRFMLKVRAKEHGVFVNTVAAVKGSIVDGSPITAAPGQPVDTGTLKASWQMAFEAPTSALISTNVEYARTIEDNIRGATLRSAVGGFHSVKLTIAGFQRLVDDENAKWST